MGAWFGLLIIGGMMIQNLQKEGIKWEAYSDEKYAAAVEAGTPIMMDFYADWCIPCLELERSTFVDPDVIDATLDFKRFKVDMTQYETEASRELRDRFEVAGVPTIVFIGPGGEEITDARVVGFLRADRFLERVNLLREAAEGKMVLVD